VHFKAFIASSVRILESHALKRDSSLHACQKYVEAPENFSRSTLACDVEEYLARIRVALNGELHVDVCRQYLAFYRNSRTAGRQCTEREFRSFLGVFQEMLRIIEK